MFITTIYSYDQYRILCRYFISISTYRLALERTKTAREAIKLMGKLAEELGFYAAVWGGDALQAEGGIICITSTYIPHIIAIVCYSHHSVYIY